MYGSISARDAVQSYVTDRQTEVTDATIKTIRSRLGMFIDYLETDGDITQLGKLEARHLHEYKVHEANNNIAPRTLQSRLSTVAVFLEWAEAMDYVTDGLSDAARALMPKVDSVRDDTLETDHAAAILTHLDQYEYASRDHAIIRLLWETGMRAGALRGLNIDDVCPDDISAESPCVRLRHRPESNTPLKNGAGGERLVAIASETLTVIQDYLKHHHIAVTDDYGRQPLFTTKHGRISKATLKRTLYRWTRPCAIGEDCPVGRDERDCEATDADETASKCPESVSTHAVRRGALTRMCRSDAPITAISDRADVTADILEKHYNQMSEAEKMDQRRKFFE